MWPLGLCSLVMFFLIFQGIQQTGKERILSRALRARIDSGVLHAGDESGSGACLLGRTLVRVKARAGSDCDSSHREEVFGDALEAEQAPIARSIQYLNVIATVSPMIGLLGTVSGMIGAFQTIARGGMGRPELLAGDIGEALITTATGLVIGIPSMISFFVLRARLADGVQRCLETGEKALLMLFPSRSEERDPPAVGDAVDRDQPSSGESGNGGMRSAS
jgi:biopolymer transport protein ExbB